MTTIREKITRVASINKRVEEFVEDGGDLKSPDAVPLGMELINTLDDLAKEFGYELLKPIKKPLFDKGPIKPDPTSKR